MAHDFSVGVYIPTYKRIGKQRTLTQFINSGSIYHPTLVCPLTEVSKHKRKWKNVVACPAKGISRTRQWILENSTEDIVVMADDDLRFFKRIPGTVRTFRVHDEMDNIISTCIKCVEDGFIHGGIAAKQGSNRVPEPYKDVTRCCNFHFVDRVKVLAQGVGYDVAADGRPITVMEDFHVILGLLTRGFPNRVIYEYCWDQDPGSVGGCNTYRTLEVQEKGALLLRDNWPEFVTVVKKVGKSNWSIAEGERTDVRIQWRKAYESSGGVL